MSTPGLKQLRDAIPKHCFRPSKLTSLTYIVRDVSLSIGLAVLALNINSVQDCTARWALWAVYGIFQGMVFTGIWILAHECGHQALFSSRLINDSFGFVLHSLLLVPYFSWKYSHGLHHRYANHMEKDTAFVPFRKNETKFWSRLLESLHIAEDAPVLNFVMLIFHQLLGWPAYMLLNVSAGSQSMQRADRASSSRQSHLDPQGEIFTTQQLPFVFLSDIGLAAVLSGLYLAGSRLGFVNVMLLYGIPYLWTNHWIVAITYLHHTHPSAYHFEAERWNFRDGALSTIDRDFGLVGKHLFHGIIEFHVIHHLFPRIPFYHAEEATQAISGLLGDQYLRVKTSFFRDLWVTFTSCRYVEASKESPAVLVWSKT